MKRWSDAMAYGFFAFVLFSAIVGITVSFGSILSRHPEIIPWLVGSICVWLFFTVLFKKGILR